MLSYFSFVKNVVFKQNSRFLGPESRKGSGRPFFANFEEGLVEKNFEKIFAENR